MLMKRLLVLLLLPLLAACGYRAPLHNSAPEDPARFTALRPDYRELAAQMATDTGLAPSYGNTVSVITDQAQKFELLKADLAAAQESIYIETYIFCPDEYGVQITDILAEKASQNVDVRIIIDMKANSIRNREALARLIKSGAAVFDFYGTSTAIHRDHRKITLIDGKIAYVGGRNIRDEYFTTWRDNDLRISGPAVNDLGVSFMETQELVAPGLVRIGVTGESALRAVDDRVPAIPRYLGKTVQIVPDTPQDGRTTIKDCYEWAINHARRYFYVYNPYSPIPSSIIKALKDAARRGVDVRWMVPANNDVPVSASINESLYRELLEAGVKVYEWKSTMNHTKQFITDDYLTAVGSCNMDKIGFYYNMEVKALVYDEEVAAAAAALFRDDCDRRCRQVTLDEVKGWTIFRKAWNWFANTGSNLIL